MAAPENPAPYRLEPDEKVAKVMVYTPSTFYWGEVVIKNVIRVSTWLRTNAVPNRIGLYNASGILIAPGSKPFSYSELHIPLAEIQAFHLVPPAQDPPDFDPTEPNRKLQPVNAILHTFLIKASIRISTNSSIKKALEVNRETFISLYDAEVSNTAMQTFRGITVPYMLVRQEVTVFTSR